MILGQLDYNHPELEWQTIETEHFQIHFYDATETTAREAAVVAERIYPRVTELYGFEPATKTDLVFLDTDDFSNGIAFFYDNKIYIWATPVDFLLRGSHRWLQMVITHEFAHIVSLQAAMKAGVKIPAVYLQFMGYEKEKRQDVLYGYPNRIFSYPVPGTGLPPWLAEGIAQYNYDGADWDIWDTHRDMILRDRSLHNKMLSLAEMNTFGKAGIGNESIYNSGYAMTMFIVNQYGSDKLAALMREFKKPLRFSINTAIKNVLGVSGSELHRNFTLTVDKRYQILTQDIRENERTGRIVVDEGSANLYPVWAPDGKSFTYISNAGNDYFSQTNLYRYNLVDDSRNLIAKGVHHAATWHPDGRTVYYIRKAVLPNRHGSSYYDIYEYDFEKDKHNRLTRDLRAYSPVYIASDSALAFLSSYDGNQNLYLLHLKDRTIERLTDFRDHRSVYGLTYDQQNERILFDYSVHHFRDIGYLSLSDSTVGDFLADQRWDERDLTITTTGSIIFADDRTGIFNLYRIDPVSGRQGYITNVTGGAFMPSVSVEGKILYSLYDNLGYKIALLDTVSLIDNAVVGYLPEFYQRNNALAPPILELDTTQAVPYEDNFTTMFLLPKLMWEYNTLKPGLYFYSTEVLERLGVFGQASVNRDSDLDLFLLFEFNRFYPTLYTEIAYLTRNKQEQNYYSVYPIDDNLRFRLIQFNAGARFPLLGHTGLDLFISWQRYRTFIKEKLPTSLLEAGVAYDYFRGIHLGLRWNGSMIRPRADSNINPSEGFKYQLEVTVEKNHFIDGLDLSDSGTLIEDFKPNNLTRVYLENSYFMELPGTRRWTLAFETNLGWLSNAEADSFFNYFGGGLPGIQGYPFYSIEGNRQAIGKFAFRIPFLYLEAIPLGWFSLNNGTIGFIVQGGDAWDGDQADFDLKRSVGLQLRLSGFSFYNYPTAIGLEVHQGLDKFDLQINGKTYNYGKEPRFYASILFEF
ncbi:MAG: hypothetical protein ABIA75_05270 [Candidatus Neomarinimicrobiota bacterium]